jgi:hypothetical protein
MKIFASLVFAILGFATVSGGHAQEISKYSYNQFKKEFANGMRNESNARVKISLLQLAPKKAEMLVDHYLALANDDDLVSRLFEEVKATGLVDRVIHDPSIARSEQQNIASLGYELFESFSLKGMKRLEYADVRVYLESVQTMFEVVPPKLCKALLMGEVTGQRETTALSAYLFSKMTVNDMNSYLRLVRKATLAEVKNFPGVKGVSDAQRKLAEESFTRVFLEEIFKHHRSEILLNAASNLGTASDADACEFGKLTIGSILKMRGTVAEWQARVFLENL